MIDHIDISKRPTQPPGQSHPEELPVAIQRFMISTFLEGGCAPLDGRFQVRTLFHPQIIEEYAGSVG